MTEYQGSFTIELGPEAPLQTVPHGLKIEGRTVAVPEGRMRVSTHGPEFRTKDGMPFFWTPSLVIAVRSSDGGMLWRSS